MLCALHAARRTLSHNQGQAQLRLELYGHLLRIAAVVAPVGIVGLRPALHVLLEFPSAAVASGGPLHSLALAYVLPELHGTVSGSGSNSEPATRLSQHSALSSAASKQAEQQDWVPATAALQQLMQEMSNAQQRQQPGAEAIQGQAMKSSPLTSYDVQVCKASVMGLPGVCLSHLMSCCISQCLPLPTTACS
jgi:hypothetical protein